MIRWVLATAWWMGVAVAAEPADPAESAESAEPADAADPSGAAGGEKAEEGGGDVVITRSDVVESEVVIGSSVTVLTIAVPSRASVRTKADEVVASTPTQAPVQVVAAVQAPSIALTPVEQLAQIAVKKRVIPEYPSELEVVYGERAIRCTARVWVDETGKPQRAAMVDCPKGFHLAALSAITAWRWERPEVAVPPEGLEVEASLGFERKRRNYLPGVTWLDAPAELTADPSLPVLLRSGSMPIYPPQVSHGDAVCRMELTATRNGATKDLVVDGCAPPYRAELVKAVRKWKWYPSVRGEEAVDATVVSAIAFRLASSNQLPPE